IPALRNQPFCLALVMALLTGCSGSPERQKAEFLFSGEKFASQQKYQQAIIQFRNAIDIDPRSAAAHYQLGVAYLGSKGYQDAYRELSTAVELDPKNLDARLEIAILLLGGRKYAEAEAAAEKVLAMEPRNARAHTILGQKHTLVQNWPLAIREFE